MRYPSLATVGGLRVAEPARPGVLQVMRDRLRGIEEYAGDAAFRNRFLEIKSGNKRLLTDITEDLTGYAIDPESLFDVQIKRIHEYKRQLLNILHVIYCWLRIREDSSFDFHPRTFLFAGKTAPGRHGARRIP